MGGVTLAITYLMKTRWLSVSDANGNGPTAMSGAETCPDCGERLPGHSPAGLCPRCLLRIGAAFALDPDTSRSLEEGAAPFGTAIARVHLRESSDDGPLI